MVKRSSLLSSLVLFGPLVFVGCTNGSQQSEVKTSQIKNPPNFLSVPPVKLQDGRDVKPGLLYKYQPLLDQNDPSGSVSLRAVRLPQRATFGPEGISWIPGTEQAGFASDFEIEATNGYGLSKRQAWSVDVASRTAPTGAGLTSWSSGSPIEFHPFKWTVAYQDDDKDSVRVDVHTPQGATYDSSTRLLTWTPPAGAAGERLIELDLVNNVGLKTPVTAKVTVASNRGPSLTSTSGGGVSAPEGTFLSVPYQVVDPEGDALDLTKFSAKVLLFGAEITPGPSITYEAVTKTAHVTWDIPVGTLLTGNSAVIEVRAQDAHGTPSLALTPLSVGDRLAPRIASLAGSPSGAIEAKPVTAFFSIVVPTGNSVQAGSIKTIARDTFGQLVTPQPLTVWNADTRTAAVTWTPMKNASYLNSKVIWSLEAKDQNNIRGTLDYHVEVDPHTPPAISTSNGASNPTSVKAGEYLFLQYKITTFDGEGLAANGVNVTALLNGSPVSPDTGTAINNGLLTVSWTAPQSLGGKTVQIKVSAKDTLGFSSEAYFPIQITP